MADSFLGLVIEKLSKFLEEEVQSLRGVDGEVKSLIDELEIIEPLLKDAEAKSERGEQNGAVKAWLRQLREEVVHIESVIVEYRYRFQEVEFQSGFRGSLGRAGNFFHSLKPRHEIASKIQTIKQSLNDIKRRARDYGLRPLEQVGSTSSQAHVDPRMASLYVKEHEFVDVNSISEEIKRNLVEGLCSRSVITLVGEGGIGKTTLAKKVFDDDVVGRHFGSVREWITVSQPYNLKKVLSKMKQMICKEVKFGVAEDDTIEELIGCLRKYLETKRYVIVFDDVWEEQFWDDIKLALPSNDKGSRVLITTRNEKIAESCKEAAVDLIIKGLKPWSPDKGWELFCKTAFQNEFQGKCPQELKQLSIDIVKKCSGLPLAIASIAGLLAAQEKVVPKWKQVLNDLNSKAESSSHVTRVQDILSLSYYNLPYHLRFCFLYFGLFPEDYAITDERLYMLWIAEGFITKKTNKTLEEVAKEYLNELIKRNLVLINQRTIFSPYSYLQVHDLMREVILSKVKDLYFCKTWDEKELRLRGKGHRLTVFGNSEGPLKNVEISVIRSLFLLNIHDELTEPSMVDLFKKLKLLEVFYVENTPIKTVPKEVGNLFCLKYLSLRETKVKELPKSISKLYHLQSLDVRDTLIRELPKEVNKLRNLRHILAYSLDDAGKLLPVSLQKGFGDLKELQTLTTLEAHTNEASFVQELEKLRKLRWLEICKLTTLIGNSLCAALEKMLHLERLYLVSIDENEVLDLQYQFKSSPLEFLKELGLLGLLETLPDWIPKLHSLTRLYLRFSKLNEETFKVVKGIPNLEILKLSTKAYIEEELHFKKGDFLKLKIFSFHDLGNLKTLKMDEGALPILEHLLIQRCWQLKEMPSFQHLINLKFVELNGKRLK